MKEWGSRRGCDVLKYIKAEAPKYGIEIQEYATCVIRKTMVLLYTRYGYRKGMVFFLFIHKCKYINWKTSQDEYSTISGHCLESDRLTTSYVTVDDDKKLAMSLRFTLHHHCRMDMTRKGIIRNGTKWN